MEEAPHSSLRSLTANSPSGVLGLSLNKHGASFHKASPANRQTGRAAALPPLKLTVPASSSESPSYESPRTNPISNNHRIMNKEDEVDAVLQRLRSSSPSSKPSPVIDSCRTLLFAATTLQMTVRRCFFPSLDTNSIGTALAKTKSSADRLMQALDLVDSRQANPDLLKAATGIIRQLKDLCTGLQQSPLLATLDAKFARHLLASIHSTTVDIKDCWENLRNSNTTIASKPQQQQQQQRPGILRSRSHSEHLLTTPSPTTTSPVMSPIAGDHTQIYNYLKLSVTHSIQISSLLKQSIDETLSSGEENGSISPSLKNKLQDLGRLGLRVGETATRLDKGLRERASKESTVSRKEFWQETNEYLKVVVTVMNLVRLTAIQEDFNWPKAVRQGCLQLTRVAAEVAKLWNSCSAFAEDGYYLGRKQDDGPSTATTGDTPNHQSPSSSSIASSLSENMS